MTKVYYTVGNLKEKIFSYPIAVIVSEKNNFAPITRHFEAIPEETYVGQKNDKNYEKRMKAYGFKS